MAPGGGSQLITSFERTSGTALDGVYTWVGHFSSSAAAGTYHIGSVVLVDALNNTASFSESKLQSLGFVTTFQITGP